MTGKTSVGSSKDMLIETRRAAFALGNDPPNGITTMRALTALHAAADEIERLLRNKPTENETNAWQPIDTAPQSGKWVLLWWPRVTDAAMVGYRVSGEWRTAPGGDAWAGFDGPTHWQPLAAGPALKASASPNDAVRWICGECSTVNSNDDLHCCIKSCKGCRPFGWPPAQNGNPRP